MKKRKTAKKRGGMMTLVVLLLIGVVTVEIVNVYEQIDTARAEEQMLTQQVEQYKRENAALASDLQRADDPEFIKEMARERLNMAEPGERIFYDVNH